jgi:hypothetical protein
MPEARSSLFRALNVTGIVNGAELRQTKVWPKISAPFCILFARNELPPPGASFRFVTPRQEDSLNDSGGLRVDASNAERVESEQVGRRPEILKVLFRGSQLDLEIYDRLMARGFETVDEFWRPDERRLSSGNGYQKLKKSSRVRKKGDGKPGVPASYLWDLPWLTHQAMRKVFVDTAQLAYFSLERIHDPRPRELFLGPLLLIHKSPPARAQRIRMAVADNDVVFNETYYGYSAKEHPDGKRLVRYLAMLVGSKYALWYALMASGELGFEREAIEKLPIDRIPAPPIEALDKPDLKRIDLLFEDLAQRGGEEAWARVDAWVASLYGLRQRDLQVLEDTLKYNLPFSANRNAAQAPPTQPETAAFRDALVAELEPWARRVNKEIAAVNVNLPITSPWGLVRVGTGGGSSKSAEDHHWPEVLRIADRLAATEVIYPNPTDGCLWVARLNQARYWSQSQARLLARRIAWEHVEFLLGLEGR